MLASGKSWTISFLPWVNVNWSNVRANTQRDERTLEWFTLPAPHRTWRSNFVAAFVIIIRCGSCHSCQNATSKLLTTRGTCGRSAGRKASRKEGEELCEPSSLISLSFGNVPCHRLCCARMRFPFVALVVALFWWWCAGGHGGGCMGGCGSGRSAIGEVEVAGPSLFSPSLLFHVYI